MCVCVCVCMCVCVCVCICVCDLEISKEGGLDPLWAFAPQETRVERTAIRSEVKWGS